MDVCSVVVWSPPALQGKLQLWDVFLRISAGFSLLSTVFLSERSSRMEATISVTCLPAAVAVRLE